MFLVKKYSCICSYALQTLICFCSCKNTMNRKTNKQKKLSLKLRWQGPSVLEKRKYEPSSLSINQCCAPSDQNRSYVISGIFLMIWETHNCLLTRAQLHFTSAWGETIFFYNLVVNEFWIMRTSREEVIRSEANNWRCS